MLSSGIPLESHRVVGNYFMFLNFVAHKKYNSLQHGEVQCCFQKLRVLIKELQMSSETGIQDVRVLIVRMAKINSFGAKRIDIRITRIREIYVFSQKIETYFSEKINGKLQCLRTKKIEK